MCGLAGMVHLNGNPIDQATLDRLTDAIAHRGPDARGTSIHENVGLGHQRLSIIDLSEAGAQPMFAAEGRFAMVYNGEVYNYQAKRAELEAKGYQFRSQSDTEVVLNLYIEYGVDCLEHLRGMFALAIYDREEHTLFIARDRLGQKPLKYFCHDDVFAFASELKALRTLPQCPAGVDWEAVHHYLTMMYVPAPQTGLAGIHKLPAAHYLLLNTQTGEQTIERYWSLDYTPDTSTSLPEWEEKIAATMEESVRLRMIADVPVGAFLSGGVDSATVVALMSKQSSAPVQTFSIGSDDPVYNELPEAKQIADAFATDHHEIPLNADIVHLLPQLVTTYEEPFADPSSIPTYLVCQKTRQTVTVALNGDGGDENFAGYVRYPIVRFSERWRRWPAPLHALVQMGAALHHKLRQTTFSYRCHRFQSTVRRPLRERSLQYLSYFTDEEKQACYTAEFAQQMSRTDAWYAQGTAEAASRAQDPISQIMSMDIDYYLAEDLLPKVDLGSMAHGLEARSPFLDHVLMEHTARMPLQYKLRGKERKWLLKSIMRGTLPDDTLDRKKRGFRLPLNRWFRRDLSDYVHDRLQATDSPLWQMFDRSAIGGLLTEYYDTKIDYSDYVWSLLWLDEWLRQYG